MLREDGKPVKRYRVCGDLARYVDEDDMKVLGGDEVKEVAAAVEDLAQRLKLEEQLLALEVTAA